MRRLPAVNVPLSGERFAVVYSVSAADAAAAHARATDIAYEQTVEFPGDLTPDGDIRQHIVGQIEAVTPAPAAPGRWRITLTYAVECVGGETTQFLNVLFGNTSIQADVRLERFELPAALAGSGGPRFGRAGLRALLGVPRRPLLCTALKPMGYGPAELARLAGQFARGGIDLIKDDHGLADQPFARFADRVRACADAVAEANARTGYRSRYLPHISAPADQIQARAWLAKELGAGGLLVCPGLVGWDAMRQLAQDERLGLPVMCHPALLGAFTASPSAGIAHFALYGLLPRLFGADATVFPSWGGRFSFSQAECAAIVAGSEAQFGGLAPSFPAPGGGMTIDRLPEMRAVYGEEVIYLIGGGLHRHSPDLAANSAYFRELVERTV